MIPRPEYLTHAWVRDATGQDIPVRILDQNEWDLIPLKNTPGTYPTQAFYNPQYPQGVLNLWPNPQTTYRQYIESMQQLAAFANLNATVSLPPGYEEALHFNLALRLVGFGIRPSDEIKEWAAKSKANIERINSIINDNKMANDFPQRPTAIHPYNILTNRPSR